MICGDTSHIKQTGLKAGSQNHGLTYVPRFLTVIYVLLHDLYQNLLLSSNVCVLFQYFLKVSELYYDHKSRLVGLLLEPFTGVV